MLPPTPFTSSSRELTLLKASSYFSAILLISITISSVFLFSFLLKSARFVSALARLSGKLSVSRASLACCARSGVREVSLVLMVDHSLARVVWRNVYGGILPPVGVVEEDDDMIRDVVMLTCEYL